MPRTPLAPARGRRGLRLCSRMRSGRVLQPLDEQDSSPSRGRAAARRDQPSLDPRDQSWRRRARRTRWHAPRGWRTPPRFGGVFSMQRLWPGPIAPSTDRNRARLPTARGRDRWPSQLRRRHVGAADSDDCCRARRRSHDADCSDFNDHGTDECWEQLPRRDRRRTRRHSKG
jgi:hypothetical protein